MNKFTEVLKKLELIKQSRGLFFPTNALVLLSEDEIKRKLFPYSKIECARFKGIKPGNFIDQKSFESSILIQPEEAYQFVLRHISQGTKDYTGVYRNDRWEYPVIAIREAIRNAVIHRDYSLSGMDVKVAIFDDKIEITSPGKLPATIDYSDMLSGQSSIRNKILAPVFKRLGIIEQWGNGLKLIANELRKYPEIGFDWKEPGMSFRVIFFKLHQESRTVEKTVEKARDVTAEEILSQIKVNRNITAKELQNITGLSRRGVEWNLAKLKQEGKIQRIGSRKEGYWKVIEKP